MLILYTHKIVDEDVYVKILEVKELDNEFIYEDKTFRFSSNDGRQAARLMNKVRSCLGFIKTKYDHIIQEFINEHF
jgi:hypothetical protein